MQIVTERLLLRPKIPADVSSLTVIRADPEYGLYLNGRPYTRAEVEAAVARDIGHQAEHGFSMFTVELRDTGEVIGDSGLLLFQLEGPDIEVGWRLGRPFWGHGYATEAGRAALELAFGELGLERVIAVTHTENAASIRVMQKLGMRYDGLLFAYGKESVRYVARHDSKL